jgi:hypothetical protein
MMPDALVSPTGNPLLFLNEDSQIVFLNFDDLRKFSIKFKIFSMNYHKYPQVRIDALAKIKEVYLEK